MSEKLKRCPFCGEPEVELKKIDGLTFAECQSCRARGPYTSSAPDEHCRHESARQWNRRIRP